MKKGSEMSLFLFQAKTYAAAIMIAETQVIICIKALPQPLLDVTFLFGVSSNWLNIVPPDELPH